MKLFLIFLATAVFLVVGLPWISSAERSKNTKTKIVILTLLMLVPAVALFGGKKQINCYGLIVTDCHGDKYSSMRVTDLEALKKELYSKANQGNAQAQSDLGELLQCAYGPFSDTAEALVWYRKAADRGNSEAQFHLGVSYEYSGSFQYCKYVDQSVNGAEEAYFWYSLAAKSNPKYSQALKRIADKLTPVQISAINKRIADWKPKFR